MKIYLYEYNVTPNIENRNILLINVEDDKVTFNDKVIENSKLIEELEEIVANNKNSLLAYNEIPHTNFKGGRQRNLKVNVDDIEVKLIGNTENNEIANFYNDFKEQIITAIEKY